MKLYRPFLLITFFFLGFTSQDSPSTSYYKPSEQLHELFEAVQLGHVFADSKTFVDAQAKFPPEEILEKYRQESNQEDFHLETFVLENFSMPEHAGGQFLLDPELKMEEHILNHWDYLKRDADEAIEQSFSSLIPLPHNYIVPGGRFREIYYWDSYFTMHGLAVSGRMDLVESMLNNFSYLIDELGFIPNGNRTYYLSRSQPPFYAGMVKIYQQHKGSQAALAYLPHLLKEYDFWMQGAGETNEENPAHRHVVRMADGSLLNRYYDQRPEPRPESYAEDVKLAAQLGEQEKERLYTDIRAAAESGWDFSSRWFSDGKNMASIHTTDIIPVDLNSLLYQLEMTIAELYLAREENEDAEKFEQLAAERKQALEKWLWDEERAFYADYDFVNRRHTPALSLAAVYPLYFGLAEEGHARLVGQKLAQEFLKDGGLVSTLVETGEQWDYPNGWAPLQWLAIQGLKEYNMPELSQEITIRWLRLNRKVFMETGKLMEKYNVVDTSLVGGGGEYPLQDGFGWTNGVNIALINP